MDGCDFTGVAFAAFVFHTCITNLFTADQNVLTIILLSKLRAAVCTVIIGVPTVRPNCDEEEGKEVFVTACSFPLKGS